MKNNLNNSNNSIVMSTRLMGVNWGRFSEKELYVILKLVSKIKPDLNDLESLRFSAKEFRDEMGISRNMSYSEMHKMIVSIMEKTIFFYEKNANNNDVKRNTFHVIEELVEIAANDAVKGSGVKELEFKFNSTFKDNILVARNAFKGEDGKLEGIIPYRTFKDNILNDLKGPYALKFYMFLLSRLHLKNIELDFEEFKSIIGFNDMTANEKTLEKSILQKNNGKRKMDKYSRRYRNFKNRTLVSLINLINEKTSLDVRLEDVVLDGKVKLNFIFINKEECKELSEPVEILEEKDAKDVFSKDKASCNDKDSIQEELNENDCNTDMEKQILNLYHDVTGNTITEGDKVSSKAILEKGFSIDDVRSKIEKEIKNGKSILSLKYILTGLCMNEEISRKENKRVISGKLNGKSSRPGCNERIQEAMSKNPNGIVDFNIFFGN